MRHGVKGRKLNRTHSHRAALMNSLTTSLLKYKRIKTTLAKAKEARKYAEAIITKARKNDLHSRRHVMRFVNDKDVVKELFNEVIPKIGDRPGGYTRITKLGNRIGDAASMAILELVDYNDVLTKKAEEHKEKKEAKKEAKAKQKNEEAETEKIASESETKPKKKKKKSEE
ncbi:MAG: 50S ribosomal protein L17 [Ignavibacteriaceae bacterium]|nr:50S ribosomal protein L17 [Ignavibacteriaceae bacterium]